MEIKVCGMKHIDNIKGIVQERPEYIGFIFYPQSKRYVGEQLQLPAYARSIRAVKKVGIFVNASFEEIIEAADSYELDMVQLHGDETPAFCQKVKRYIPVIKAFHIHPLFDFDSLSEYITVCSFFLFDTAVKEYGGSGRAFNWQLLDNYKIAKDFFLSGGISLENIGQIKQINHPRLVGIDVNSCFETEPGLKDITKLNTLLHEVRN